MLAVQTDAVVTIDGYLCRVADLEPGMRVNVFLTRDRKTATRLFAEWVREGDLRGKVQAVEAATGEIRVTGSPGPTRTTRRSAARRSRRRG